MDKMSDFSTGMEMDSNIPQRFSDVFWGDDGWEALARRLKHSKIAMEEFVKLIKNSIMLEQDYATRLSHMAKLERCETELGACREAYRRIQSTMVHEADQHSQLAAYLQEHVASPITLLHDDQQKRRQVVKRHVASIQKKYNASVQVCTEKRQKYNKVAMELEALGLTHKRLAAVNEVPIPQIKRDLDKMKVKIAKLESDLDHAKTAYTTAVSEAETERVVFENEYYAAMEDLQRMEEERIQQLSNVLNQMVDTHVGLEYAISTSLNDMKDLFNNVLHVNIDIANIIAEVGPTQTSRPQCIVFEEYRSQYDGLDMVVEAKPDSTSHRRTRGMTMPAWFKKSSPAVSSPPSNDPLPNEDPPPTPTHVSPEPDHVKSARELVPTISEQMGSVQIDESHQWKCRAVYDYTAQDETELSFVQGDMIIIVERGSMGWWFGRKPGTAKGFDISSQLRGRL